MQETGLCDLEAFKDGNMVRARVISRHLAKVKYFVYIRYKPNVNSTGPPRLTDTRLTDTRLTDTTID